MLCIFNESRPFKLENIFKQTGNSEISNTFQFLNFPPLGGPSQSIFQSTCIIPMERSFTIFSVNVIIKQCALPTITTMTLWSACFCDRCTFTQYWYAALLMKKHDIMGQKSWYTVCSDLTEAWDICYNPCLSCWAIFSSLTSPMRNRTSCVPSAWVAIKP